ncbi:MAG: cell division protein FtsB [Pseudomonadota bacterium]|jgi:cell division protein FtsB
MKWLAFALLAVVAATQYRLWLSDSGLRGVAQLQDSVASQKAENERLAVRNRQLAEEVRDLKQGFEALEEHARSDLGLVANNEVYYQVVPSATHGPSPAVPKLPIAPLATPADSPTRTASR